MVKEQGGRSQVVRVHSEMDRSHSGAASRRADSTYRRWSLHL